MSIIPRRTGRFWMALLTIIGISGCGAPSTNPQPVTTTGRADVQSTQPTITSISATPTPMLDIGTAARGYWVTVGGDQTFREYPGKIYFYNWYAIQLDTATIATITWDTGLNCARTKGRVERNEVQLNEGGVEVMFVIHDAATATATFRQQTMTYTKQLEKQRDDPTVLCD